MGAGAEPALGALPVRVWARARMASWAGPCPYSTMVWPAMRASLTVLPVIRKAFVEDIETAAGRGDVMRIRQIGELQDRTMGILAKAEGSGNLRTALMAVREARGCLELLAKVAAYAREQEKQNVQLTTWGDLAKAVTRAEKEEERAAHPRDDALRKAAEVASRGLELQVVSGGRQ